jgi:hypothetical protein
LIARIYNGINRKLVSYMIHNELITNLAPEGNDSKGYSHYVRAYYRQAGNSCAGDHLHVISVTKATCQSSIHLNHILAEIKSNEFNRAVVL